ncbi:MAG: hypothetical protein JNM93_13410 [Bacteriovoracaceae bacterium]|nr:hypothetical protein [Bacteriovoracaceae bacterium]
MGIYKRSKDMPIVKKILVFVTLVLIGLLVSCVPTTPPTLSDQDGSEITNPGDTNYGDKIYFQMGSTTTTSLLEVNYNYTDTLYMRGNHVNNYTKQVPASTKFCVAMHFPNSTIKKLLVISAKVNYFNNFSTGQLEYYLKLAPQDQTINQNDCLTTSLNTALNTKFGTSLISYKLDSVCANCGVNLSSNAIEIYTNAGAFISQMPTNHLSFKILPSSQTNNGNTCTSNTACVSQGYSCCLSGQCVTDGAIKSGVNLSDSGFVAAQLEVASNPAAYLNYPGYYYICGTQTPTTPPTDPVVDAELQKRLLLEKYAELRECVTPSIDEMSFCTKTINGPSALITGNGGSYIFEADIDDQIFSKVNPAVTTDCTTISGTCSDARKNIAAIDFNGEIIFKECEVPLTAANGTIGSNNNNLFNAQTVNLKKTTTSANDYLKIKYRIDGSCTKLNSGFAQCRKLYVQGQQSCPQRPSDHTSGSQVFQLPDYADTSYNLIVKVNDEIIPQSATTWSAGPGEAITFAPGFTIYDNQTIDITYFTTSAKLTGIGSSINNLIKSKTAAQSEINTICNCGSNMNCNLTPVTETVNGIPTVTEYECLYPSNDTGDIPLQQTIYVSSKAAPIRFYDKNGVHYNSITATTSLQELNTFEYTSGNQLKPNNIINDSSSGSYMSENYIGPNEVYGNMNRPSISGNPTSAPIIDNTMSKPPVKVDVEKGKSYNIYVDSGGFSSCSTCGSDYYSNLKRLFPETFTQKGGGLEPDPVETNPASTLSDDRRDDTLFARACYVPMTMIPWTHKAYTTLNEQRRTRLQAQHFLFANGYSRDWYGFDYGSLIASYDGANWFSVGNRRKTTAKTNKLYFATNAMFGDLTNNNSFKVVITEITDFDENDSDVLFDPNSDGAQCQKHHYCSTDADCIKQVGFDYACVDVSSLSTNWPKFDSSSVELTNVSQNIKLHSLLDGGLNGQAKRCMYRGRGSVCQDDIYSVISSSSLSYANSNKVGAHSCASNYYCESLSASSKFNINISRFASSPLNQNSTHCTSNDSSQNDCTDTIGVSARVIGRPYKFHGTKSISAAGTTLLSHFNSSNVNSICIPGRNPSNANMGFSALSGNAPTSRNGDKLLGIAPTLNSTQNNALYSVCPTYDSTGNYFINQLTADAVPSAEAYRKYAASQNILSNALGHSEFAGLDLFSDSTNLFESFGYRQNTCLRAPGAACFSDYECAPSTYISQQIDSILTPSSMNEAELAFWQEPMVCGNSADKRQPYSIMPNTSLDLKNNKCCREVGKAITIYTADFSNSAFDGKNIPGIGIDLQSDTRYSRLNTIADIIGTTPPSTTPTTTYLIKPNDDSGLASTSLSMTAQYKTFDTLASRTCCSSSWVRDFHEDQGGGHHWLPSKLQDNLKVDAFRCLSWAPNTSDNFSGQGLTPFVCQPGFQNTSECEAKNFTSTEESKYLSWLNKLELTGIPQIMIESATNSNGAQCIVDDNQVAVANKPLDGTILPAAVPEYTIGGASYLSAADPDNFVSDIKMVFSEKKVSCCRQAGVALPANATDNECCTGKKFQGKCCLEDFTNISVYLNRYVSSEANNLSDALFNSSTGFLNSPDDAVTIAKQKKICCSGKAAFGRAISELFIPGAEAVPDAKRRRFVYSSGVIDNNSETGNAYDVFEAGVRWNNHLYCVPDDFPGETIDVSP